MAATTLPITPSFSSLEPGEEEWSITTGTPTLFQGALVCRNSSGVIVDPTETTGLKTFRTFLRMADSNTGTKIATVTKGVLTSAANGTKIVVTKKPRWCVNGESIAETDIGAIAYCDDNQSAKTTSTSTSGMGTIEQVDTDRGVLVNFYAHDSVVPNDSITAAKIAAGAVGSSEVANGAIDPVHRASTAYRSVASDGALAIVNTDENIHLVGSAAGTKAATLTSAVAAQRLKLYLAAASGGSYTVACDMPAGTSGTLTLNAADESPELAYDGSDWVVMDLGGATFA